jgi:hypothetical protein
MNHARRPFLQSLNLFFNALATSTLKVMNLYGCCIGDDGAVILSKALSFYVLDEHEIAIVQKLVDNESKQKFSDECVSLLKKKQKTPPKKSAGKSLKKNRPSTSTLHPSSCQQPWAGDGKATLTSLILDDNVIGHGGAMAHKEHANHSV